MFKAFKILLIVMILGLAICAPHVRLNNRVKSLKNSKAVIKSVKSVKPAQHKTTLKHAITHKTIVAPKPVKVISKPAHKQAFMTREQARQLYVDIKPPRST